jgi:DNA-binding transcriptional regulator YiaG
MKLDQLRKVIREEVRAAVKEELQEVMNEAVKYASTPTTQQLQTSAEYTPVKQKDLSRSWSTGKINQGTVPLEEMLNDTRASMTGEDIRNISGGGGVSKPNFASMMSNQMVRETTNQPTVGVDLSQIPGLNKAKDILEAAYAKDKNKAI